MDAKSIMLIIHYAAVAILFVEIAFVLLQSSSEIQKWSLMLGVAAILLFVGYNIEMSAECLSQAMTGAAVSYMGKPFVMLYSYMFIITFYHLKRPPKWLFVVLNFLCTAFSCLVFSNHRHYLYYSYAEYDSSQVFSPLVLGHGPMYFVYAAFAIAYFISCICAIIKGSRNLKDSKSKHLNIFIFIMIAAGILGYLAYLAGVTSGYDTTVAGVFIGVLCLAYIFIKSGLFDAVLVAKDMALADSPTGLIVFDNANEINYINATASKYLDDVLTVDFINNLDSDNYKYIYGDNAIDIATKEVVSKGVRIGKAVEITDITELYNYQIRLEKDVKERTEKIANIQRDIIASVANIIEARSVETGQHIKRTSVISTMIAKSLRDKKLYTDVIDDSFIEMIGSAAPLHDIGKIAVPDHILLKPGQLTPDEFEIVKTHVDSGAEIIKRTMQGLESKEYTDMALDIAAYHHERWDGNGYTHSMKGEEIPLSARIVAVADCFDAIISDRCYKKAVPVEQAMEIIRSESGTHFDPMVVYAFEDAMKQTGMRLQIE